MPNGITPFAPSYDFAHFAKLNMPVNGERLAAQLEALSAFSQELLDYLDATLGANGELKKRKLTRADLAPDLLAELDAGVKRQIATALLAIETVAASFAASDLSNKQTLTNLSVEVGRAYDACEQARANMEQAGISAQTATECLATAAAARTEAENDANSARGSAADARLSEEYAYLWAEYLAGPVVVAQNGDPVFNEAVSGGYWSAKWWALQAQRAVSDTVNWYLGPFPAPPVENSTGGPLLDGMMYFDTTIGQLYVWADGAWQIKLQPTVGVLGTWTYFSTDGQSVFTGPDFSGRVPDWKGDGSWRVLVNGVQLFHTTGGITADYVVDEPNQRFTLKEAGRSGDIVTLEKVITAASFAGQLTPTQLQAVVDAILAEIGTLADLVTKPQMMELAQYLVNWFKPVGDNKPGAVLTLTKPGYEYQALPGDFAWTEPLDYLGFILSQPDAEEYLFQTLLNGASFAQLIKDLIETFLPQGNPAPTGVFDAGSVLFNQLGLMNKIGAKGPVIRGYSPTQNDPTRTYLWEATGQLVGEILTTKYGYTKTEVDAAIDTLRTEIGASIASMVGAINTSINALTARVSALEPGPWQTPSLASGANPTNSTIRFRMNGEFIEFKGEVYFYPSIADGQTVDFGSVTNAFKPAKSHISLQGGGDGIYAGAYIVEVLNGTGTLRLTTNGQACFRLSVDGMKVSRN